jgi:phosphopantetheinyl transferase
MVLLHCARVPAALPPQAEAALLGLLAPAHAADLRRRLERGTGLESATGLALLASCARLRALPPLSAIERPGHGKPHWPDGPEFSISHAGGFAACAVARAGIAIGIDLEPPGRLAPRALRLVLSAAERAALGDDVDATAIWTCKEAVIKAAGGRFADLRRAAVAGASGELDGRRFHLQQQVLDGGILLAIASSEPLAAVPVRWVREEELFSLDGVREGL